MQSNKNPLAFLIIEDNQPDFFLIEKMLRSLPFAVAKIHSASRIGEAEQLIKENRIDLILFRSVAPGCLVD